MDRRIRTVSVIHSRTQSVPICCTHRVASRDAIAAIRTRRMPCPWDDSREYSAVQRLSVKRFTIATVWWGCYFQSYAAVRSSVLAEGASGFVQSTIIRIDWLPSSGVRGRGPNDAGQAESSCVPRQDFEDRIGLYAKLDRLHADGPFRLVIAGGGSRGRHVGR